VDDLSAAGIKVRVPWRSEHGFPFQNYRGIAWYIVYIAIQLISKYGWYLLHGGVTRNLGRCLGSPTIAKAVLGSCNFPKQMQKSEPTSLFRQALGILIYQNLSFEDNKHTIVNHNHTVSHGVQIVVSNLWVPATVCTSSGLAGVRIHFQMVAGI
jgi:hypothetical protein